MKKLILSILIFLSMESALQAHASANDAETALKTQETPQTSGASQEPDKNGNAIVIKGIRNPEDMAYASFVAAQKAFEENRHYAPDAPLLFQMKTHSGEFDGLRLSIASDNSSIPVAYDAQGQFVLPHDAAALRDQAVVTVDKKRGEIFWMPVIRSHDLAQSTLRLGDLRLYCRVQWELEKADASVGTKMMNLLMGGCSSNSFFTLGLPQPGMRVRLVSKDRQEILLKHYVAHRTRWQPPYGDATWPDDTRVEFLAPEDGFALDEACRTTREKNSENSYQHSYGTFDPESCAWRPN